MQQRPNLLYIHSDQHNPYVMGCAGDPVVETPHLDPPRRRGRTMHPSVLSVAGVRGLAHGHARGALPQRHRGVDQQSDPRFRGPDDGPLYGSGRVSSRADRPHALHRPRPTARLCRKAGRRPLLQLARRGTSPGYEPQQSRESRPGTELVPSTRRGRNRSSRVLLKSTGSAKARRSIRRPLQPQHRLYAAAFSLFGAASPVRLLPSENSPAHSPRAFWRSPPSGDPLVAGPRRFAGRARGMGAQRPGCLLGLGRRDGWHDRPHFNGPARERLG